MITLLFCLLCSSPVWTGGNPYPTIGAIPVPAGYHRLSVPVGAFGAWLRAVPLKKDLTVFLYNGKAKVNQDADAVMRLRAEYFWGAE